MNLKKDTDKFVLVDVNALVHRAYHAYPETLSSNGIQTNAVFGFSVLLLEVLEKFHPEYVVCCMDVGKAKERLKLFPDYKATRKPMDPELATQLPLVQEVIEAFNLKIYAKDGYEADDMIGSIISKKKIENNPNLETIIVTGDKDIFQLVDHNTYVYMAGSSFSKSNLYGVEEVKVKMGFGPEFVVDYKAIRGDASDNIPGVKGIGDKGALDLITKYGHLENILANIESIEQSRMKKALAAHLDEAKMSYKLATIMTDLDVDFQLEDVRFNDGDMSRVYDVFMKYRFNSLLKRIANLRDSRQSPGQQESTPLAQINLFQDMPAATKAFKKISNNQLEYVLLNEGNIKDFLETIEQKDIFAFDTETDSLSIMECELVGASFAFKSNQAYYLPASLLNKPEVLQRVKRVFGNKKVKKIGHNIKFDMHALKNVGIEVEGVSFDTMLAAYILQMGRGGIGLKELALVRCGMNMVDFKELLALASKKGDINTVPIEKLYTYACADADATYRLYELFKDELEHTSDFSNIFYKIEVPLIPVLFKMERMGISMDTKYLKDFSKTLDEDLVRLKTKIIELAGVDFNISSPKQVGEVLFGKLGLTSLKKTSSGTFSTNENVLREIKSQHPIVGYILEYRELSKLRSTYTDALIAQVNASTGRVHTSYNQAIATTGRLSSVDPNLQNIPVATELGNKIRKAFVADKGKIFVSFDYSQQELRILSSVSRDKKLVDSYKKNKDIHKLTASKLYGVTLDGVEKVQRMVGKTVNFSVVYGISAFGLSDRLKIPQDVAQGFIDKYFETYPGVKRYFDDLLSKAKVDGYVSTPKGRRRDASELNSKNFRVRKAVEREVINFPIQGGAADMVKIGMLMVSEKLADPKWKDYKMLLQVHDELLFEVPDKGINGLKEFFDLVRSAMMEANEYDVEMKVDIGVGKSWGGVEEISY